MALLVSASQDDVRTHASGGDVNSGSPRAAEASRSLMRWLEKGTGPSLVGLGAGFCHRGLTAGTARGEKVLNPESHPTTSILGTPGPGAAGAPLVLAHKVQVVPPHSDGSGHFRGQHDPRQDAAADGHIACEGTLLVDVSPCAAQHSTGHSTGQDTTQATTPRARSQELLGTGRPCKSSPLLLPATHPCHPHSEEPAALRDKESAQCAHPSLLAPRERKPAACRLPLACASACGHTPLPAHASSSSPSMASRGVLKPSPTFFQKRFPALPGVRILAFFGPLHAPRPRRGVGTAETSRGSGRAHGLHEPEASSSTSSCWAGQPCSCFESRCHSGGCRERRESGALIARDGPRAERQEPTRERPSAASGTRAQSAQEPEGKMTRAVSGKPCWPSCRGGDTLFGALLR